MTHTPSLNGFRESTQRYGWATGLKDLGYRLLRKTTSINLHHVIAMNCAENNRPRDNGHICRFLSADEVGQFSKYPVYGFDSSMPQRILSGQDVCYALVINGNPVSYAWFAFGSIEEAHSAGIAASFPDKIAYFYKAYTLPEYRGQGLSRILLTYAIEVFLERNYESIFGFVEICNHPSKISCAKIGFENIGLTISALNSRTHILTGSKRLNDLGIVLGEGAKVLPRS